MKRIYLLFIITVLASCGVYSPYYNGRLIHGKSVKQSPKEIDSKEKEDIASSEKYTLEPAIELTNEQVLNEETTPELTNSEVSQASTSELILVKSISTEIGDSTEVNTLEEPEEVVLEKAKKAEKSAKKAVVFGALGFTPISGLVFMIIGWIFLAKALRSRYITEKGQKYAVRATIVLSIVTALLLSIIIASTLFILFL